MNCEPGLIPYAPIGRKGLDLTQSIKKVAFLFQTNALQHFLGAARQDGLVSAFVWTTWVKTIVLRLKT